MYIQAVFVRDCPRVTLSLVLELKKWEAPPSGGPFELPGKVLTLPLTAAALGGKALVNTARGAAGDLKGAKGERLGGKNGRFLGGGQRQPEATAAAPAGPSIRGGAAAAGGGASGAAGPGMSPGVTSGGTGQGTGVTSGGRGQQTRPLTPPGRGAYQTGSSSAGSEEGARQRRYSEGDGRELLDDARSDTSEKMGDAHVGNLQRRQLERLKEAAGADPDRPRGHEKQLFDAPAGGGWSSSGVGEGRATNGGATAAKENDKETDAKKEKMVKDLESAGALDQKRDAAKGLDQMTRKVRGRIFLEVSGGALADAACTG